MTEENSEKKIGWSSLTASLLLAGVFVFLGMFFTTKPANAINQQITFQGKLTNTAGYNVANGTYYVKLTIYDAASGGVCQYSATSSCASVTSTPVTVTNGIFSVNLGDTAANLAALPATLFNSPALYLGITVCAGPGVGCDSEMTPRKRLTSVPYAFNADYLGGITTSTAGGNGSYIPATDSSGNLRLSNSFYVATSTAGQVGIGTSTVPSGIKTYIESTTASDKMLVIRGQANQTGSLTEWQDSAGNVLGSFATGTVSLVAGDQQTQYNSVSGLVNFTLGNASKLGGFLTLQAGATTAATGDNDRSGLVIKDRFGAVKTQLQYANNCGYLHLMTGAATSTLDCASLTMNKNSTTYLQGTFKIDSSGNASASGTITVWGSQTASSSILSGNLLKLGIGSGYNSGIFSIDSSGNASVSGTFNLGSYAQASLPTSGTPGRLARVTNDVRGLWMDQGTQWFSLNENVVNVQEFGAKGDGVTNDYSAFAAAITAAGASGTVRVPKPSVYYYIEIPATYTAFILTQNVRIEGTSGDVKIKVGPEAPTTPVPPLGNAWTLFWVQPGVSLTIENLTLEGPNNNNGRNFTALYHYPGAGGITARRITSTKFGQFLKAEETSQTGQTVVVEDSDITTKADDTGLSSFLILDYVTFHLRRCKVTNTSVGTQTTTVAYLAYIYTTANVDIDNCNFGDSASYGIHFWGGAGSPAPDYVSITNSRFKGSYSTAGVVTAAAILTNNLTKTYIVNDTFNIASGTGKSIVVNGDAVVSNSNFYNGDIELFSGSTSAASSTVYFDQSNFTNAPISPQSTVTTTSLKWYVTNSHLNSTSTAYNIQMYARGGYLSLNNNIFEGATAEQILLYGGELEANNNHFLNSNGSYGIKTLPGSAGRPLITAQENYFQDSTKAFSIETASDYTPSYVNLRPRHATTSTPAASASSLTLDWNYDTYRVTGATAINNIYLQDSAQTLFSAGTITLLPDTGSTWALSNTGNIKAASGPRQVDRAINLTYFPARTAWFQTEADANLLSGSNFLVTNDLATSSLGANFFSVASSTTNMNGLFYVNSSGNVSASGTFTVFGASTFGGNLNPAADNLYDIGSSSTQWRYGNFQGGLLVGDGTTTSTLLNNSLTLGQTSGYNVGKFYVDSSGNTSVSGTLSVFGNSTLGDSDAAGGDTTRIYGALSVGTAPTGNAQIFVKASSTTAVPLLLQDNIGGILLRMASSTDDAIYGGVQTNFNGLALLTLGDNQGRTGVIDIKNAGALVVRAGGTNQTVVQLGNRLGATGGELILGTGSATSTLDGQTLTLGQASGYNLGTFYVNSIGNVNASGSVGFGSNITSTGQGSLAFGNVVSSTGQQAFAGGKNTTANGQQSFAFGQWAGAYGAWSVAMGNNVTSSAAGNTNFAFGNNVQSTANNTFVFGRGDYTVDNAPLTNNIQESFMVGFGSSTPALLVAGSGVISSVGIATTTVIYGGTTRYRLLVDANGNTNPGIGVIGYIKATGSITPTTGLDLAEKYPIDPVCSTEDNCPEVGEVVAVNGSVLDDKTFYIYKAIAETNSQILGVVSTRAGFILSGGLDESNSREVALAGRVPVKVSVENGAIKVGDKLTVSAATPGAAMKYTGSGTIIGLALENYSSLAPGKILIYVSLSWEKDAGNPANLNIGSDSSGQLTQKDLDLYGHNILNIKSLVGQDNKWAIDENGWLINNLKTSTGDKKVYGMSSENAELTLSGSGQLVNGEARIEFEAATKEIISSTTPMKISVTLTAPANGVYVSEKGGWGFAVKELNSGVSGATFDWVVIARRKTQAEIDADASFASVIPTQAKESSSASSMPPLAADNESPAAGSGEQNVSTTSTENQAATGESQ